MSVTTRMMFFLLGNPYKPSFVTVGWGVDLRYADRSDSWSISLVRNDLQVSVFDEILDGHPMTIVVLLVVDPQKELKVTSFDLIKKGWQLAEFLLRFHGQLRSIPLKSFGRESRRRRR